MMAFSDAVNAILIVLVFALGFKIVGSLLARFGRAYEGAVAAKVAEAVALLREDADALTRIVSRLTRENRQLREQNEALSDVSDNHAGELSRLVGEMQRAPMYYDTLMPFRCDGTRGYAPGENNSALEYADPVEITVDLNNSHPMSTVVIREADTVIVHAINLEGEHCFWRFRTRDHMPGHDDIEYAYNMSVWTICALAINTGIRVSFMQHESYEWHTGVGMGEVCRIRPLVNDHAVWGTPLRSPQPLKNEPAPPTLHAPAKSKGGRVLRMPKS